MKVERYDGKRETFFNTIRDIYDVAFDLQECFDGINEYIEEDLCVEDEMHDDGRAVNINKAHDLAYRHLQTAIDLKWKAKDLQDHLKAAFPTAF